MNSFEFRIYCIKNPELKIITNLIWYLIVFIWAISVFFFSPINSWIAIVVILILFIPTPIFLVYIENNKTKYENKGKIIFNKYIYSINDIEFCYEEINFIKLKYKGYFGVLLTNLRSFIWKTSKGKENIIEIHSKNKVIKYNVYLDDINDYIQFKLLYHFFTEKGIKVKINGFTESMDIQPNGKPLM